MEGTFDVKKAAAAQARYCNKNKLPHFAPYDGRCFRCNKNIYKVEKNQCGVESGISVERAGSQLITGCPHCHWSYCE